MRVCLAIFALLPALPPTQLCWEKRAEARAFPAWHLGGAGLPALHLSRLKNDRLSPLKYLWG
jgi:hypothetical protein